MFVSGEHKATTPSCGPAGYRSNTECVGTNSRHFVGTAYTVVPNAVVPGGDKGNLLSADRL